jgi:tetratricopeptide (TPR) repeat protein
MARFDRLETDAVTPQRRRPPPPEPERDEHYWLAEAVRHRRLGQYESALRGYSRALENDKSLPGAWLGQVQMLILLDEAPEADTWGRKALELFPANGDLLAARAQALCRQGDIRQALALSDAALAAAGQSAYRWQARGELMVAQKQSTDRHCFDKAYQVAADWLTELETALIYLHYQQPAKALARARMASEAALEECYAWYVRGLAEAQLAMPRDAQRSFSRCLELAPGHHDASSQLRQLASGGWSPRALLRRWFGN